MSSWPKATSVPASSAMRRRRRWASGTPRVWMPTSATRSSSGLASTISCAIRVSVGSIASQPLAEVAPARERVCLQPERGRVVALLGLHTDAVLPGRGIEGPEELPPARADELFQPLPGRPHLLDEVPDAQEHHVDRLPLDLVRHAASATARSHSCR